MNSNVGVLEINAVQALLLFNVGDNGSQRVVKTRGYYQGSNVQPQKLVEMGYMHHQHE
jgi:hypothetical protein